MSSSSFAYANSLDDVKAKGGDLGECTGHISSPQAGELPSSPELAKVTDVSDDSLDEAPLPPKNPPRTPQGRPPSSSPTSAPGTPANARVAGGGESDSSALRNDFERFNARFSSHDEFHASNSRQNYADQYSHQKFRSVNSTPASSYRNRFVNNNNGGGDHHHSTHHSTNNNRDYGKASYSASSASAKKRARSRSPSSSSTSSSSTSSASPINTNDNNNGDGNGKQWKSKSSSSSRPKNNHCRGWNKKRSRKRRSNSNSSSSSSSSSSSLADESRLSLGSLVGVKVTQSRESSASGRPASRWDNGGSSNHMSMNGDALPSSSSATSTLAGMAIKPQPPPTTSSLLGSLVPQPPPALPCFHIGIRPPPPPPPPPPIPHSIPSISTSALATTYPPPPLHHHQHHHHQPPPPPPQIPMAVSGNIPFSSPPPALMHVAYAPPPARCPLQGIGVQAGQIPAQASQPSCSYVTGMGGAPPLKGEFLPPPPPAPPAGQQPRKSGPMTPPGPVKLSVLGKKTLPRISEGWGVGTIANYEIVTQVGEGTYGQVYKALERQSRRLVALKKVRLENEKEGFPITAIREIKILRQLDHPNIVKLLDIVTENDLKSDTSAFYLVFEYVDHDLMGLLESQLITLTELQIASFMKQLLLALDYSHSHNFLHRDLKCSNILISNSGQLKLADFGLARFYHENHHRLYTNRVITLWYRPPELLLGEERYGPAVDIWSVGCILAELFVRKPIFQGNSDISQLELICQVCGTPSPANWPDVENLSQYDVMRPRRPHPRVLKERFSFMPRPTIELLDRMLTLAPERRITAGDALRHAWLTDVDPSLVVPPALPRHQDCHEMWCKNQKRKRFQIS